MLSKNNKMIHCKVSKDVFKFINTFSRRYGVSVSSFCQDCITNSILEHAKKSSSSLYKSPEEYYKKLSKFIQLTYDERRK